ncbi:hypothetical protein ACFUGD_16105 [Streptomyces sp. NPDC057217]|uniref:hypothetical protein n=1 Tax=Streptomyces sp. NPDC057217 TaxID=3346054 RepID=UPI00362DE834
MADIKKLEDFFGASFISYILGQDDVAMSSDSRVFPPGALELLDGICVSTAYQEPHVRWMNVAANVMRYIGDQEMSLANYMRQLGGGDLARAEETTDSLLNSLLRVACEIYPAFLVKRPHAEPLMGNLACGSEFLAHSEGLAFTVALLDDQDTSALFPDRESLAGKAPAEQSREIIDVQSYAVTSGVGLQILRLHSFGEHILNSAFHRMVTANEGVSREGFLREVSRVLDDIRKLGRGESIDVAVVVGLAQLAIDRSDVELGSGRIVKRKFCYANEGSGAPWNPIVLVAKQKYKIHKVESVVIAEGEFNRPDFQSYHRQVREWHSEIDWATDKCCLAIYMASDVARPSGVVPAFTAVLEPFTHYPIEPWTSRPQPSVAAIHLSEESAIEVSNWYSKIQNSHPASLNIAIRRMVSACNGRYSPSDSLLDAVLAWENMFSGTPETVLRVCGAMASLLAPGGYEDRRALYERVKKIYNARSQIVHGKSKRNLTEALIQEFADSAIEFAFKALKELYGCPEILTLGDSDARGLAVLLGAAQVGNESSNLQD